VPAVRPVRVPVEAYIWAAAAFGTAALIVIHTLAEDVLTAGVGVADDPASMAAAAAMVAIGIAQVSEVQGPDPITIDGAGGI